MTSPDLEARLSRVISPRDGLYPAYAAQFGPDEYFRSGLRDLGTIEGVLTARAGKRLNDCDSIADFACHYGRLLRCLRAALPDGVLYAYDIDADATAFCAREFGCIPLPTGWDPERVEVTARHDLVICLSLLTHTRLTFLRSVLALWERMLKPGGLLLFTYLGESYIDEWRAGRLDHYAQVSEAARKAAIRAFRRDGHAFCGGSTPYSPTGEYGIGFAREALVRAEVARHEALSLVETRPGFSNGLGQDLAVVQRRVDGDPRPGASRERDSAAPAPAPLDGATSRRSWLRRPFGRSASPRGTVPAFLSIDVEPVGFQPANDSGAEWTGFPPMIEIAERLRSDLRRRSGGAPRFGWYVRTDPQIAEVFGRADHILARHADRVAGLQAAGDYLGVHAHALRWSADRGQWVHEFSDTDWLAEHTRSSLDAFARWSGSPARRFRGGAGFLANVIVETLDRCGVEVELSLDPMPSPTVSSVHTTVDSSPIVGTLLDCRAAPRAPFHPARHDFRVPDDRRGRKILLIPQSTYDAATTSRRWWSRTASAADVLVLYPSFDWPSPEYYWDLVARQLESMARPYLSLSARTDAPDSVELARVRRLFEFLPRHPLADRLRFVDPLTAASALV